MFKFKRLPGIAALLFAMGQTLHAAPLVDAARITTGNDQHLRFNQVYRFNPHNSYNPDSYTQLTQPLSLGARILEIDLYGSHDRPNGSAACSALGGVWQNARCYGYERGLDAQLRSALRQVIAGETVTNNAALPLMNLDVKHDPVAEDGLTKGAVDLFLTPLGAGWLWDLPDHYGNNCSDVSAPSAGNMRTQLGNCLATVKAWMDSNPGHTPLIIYLDVKRDPNPMESLALDITLRSTFGAALFTPENLKRFPSDTPRNRVLQAGWPSMKDMRGKVIVIYTGGETFQWDGGAIANDTPNDTLRQYIGGVAGMASGPAAFPCPRASRITDVDTPYGFGRNVGSGDAATLMSYVTCVNIYTGGYARAQQTHSQAFERAMDIVGAANSRNMLSYVWSYNDTLALHPGVAQEFVRRGVTFFDTEHAKSFAFGRSPLNFSRHLLLPLEGVGGITRYGLFIRQRNNPNFVLANVNGAVRLAPFDGSLAQQWAIDDWGRVRSGQDPSQCIGVETLVPANSVPARAGARYYAPFSQNIVAPPDPATPSGNLPPPPPHFNLHKVAPGVQAKMVGCDDLTKARSFTLVPANPGFLPGLDYSQTTGLLFKATATEGDLYLTPSEVNETGIVTLAPRNHAAYALTANPSAPNQGGGAGDDIVPVTPPFNTPLNPRTIQPNAASDYIHLQQFALTFDKDLSQPLALPGWAPPRAALAGQEPLPGSRLGQTWRDFPINASPEPAGVAALPPLQRGLWAWANWFYFNSFPEFNGDKVLTRTLPYTGFPPLIYTRDHTGVTSQLAASEFLSPLEYEKWLSAMATEWTDMPKDPKPEVAALAVELFYRDEVNQDLKYNPWQSSFIFRQPPVQPGSVCCDYLDIRNHPELWYLASRLLSAEDYTLWQRRRDITPDRLPLNPTLTEIARALLDREAELGVPSNEFLNWQGEAQDCLAEMTSACEKRFLPSENQGALTWKDIPMTAANIPIARAAFGLADVDFNAACAGNAAVPHCSASIRAAHWDKWERGLDLRRSLGRDDLTFLDVPTTAPYAEIAAGLLAPEEYKRYLEHRRVQLNVIALGQPVTHLTIDPEDIQRPVAAHFLSSAELALWEERTAVARDDFPLNAQVFAAKGAILLSAAEYQATASVLAEPGQTQDPAPQYWHDARPGKGKRFAAQHLLTAAEYAKWQEVALADERDFPQVWTNSYVNDIALRSLSADEYAKWSQALGTAPPQVSNLNWLMVPRRPSAKQIALRILPNVEAQKWVDMLNQPLVPQHLGRSPANQGYAKSVLTAEQFAVWSAYATQGQAPNDWRQFTYDTSSIQERVVEAVFGANSPNHIAWRAAAGR